jgi:adenosylhomocysteine nucleosidase
MTPSGAQSIGSAQTDMSPEIAIFCAIEEEIRPLVRRWERRKWKVGETRLPCFQRAQYFAMCAGMGAGAARKSIEAVLQEFRPELIISAGFAGALRLDLHIGEVIRPAELVDESTGRRFEIESGEGTVISSPRVADPSCKRDLAARFGAQAVDMEGAALAQVAAEHGVRFMAVKAISDELDFPLLDFAAFTDAAGQLQRPRLAAFAAVRPWTWLQLVRLRANCRSAAGELCRTLEHLISEREGHLRGPASDRVTQPRSH